MVVASATLTNGSVVELSSDDAGSRSQVPPNKTPEQESAITNAASQVLEQETSIMETSEAEAGKSGQKRKRGRLPKSRIEMPNDLLQGSCHSPLDHREPSDALIPPVVNNLTGCQQEWPFIKQSPVWAAIESLEFYQNPPQKPHFSRLKEVKEDRREGLAIGQFVTFANMVQRTSELKLDDPSDMIVKSLETLVELETHGFDVGAVRARLNELLSRRVQVGELKDKEKRVKEELEERNLEKSKIDEELVRLKGKIQDLEEKLAESAKKKEVKDEKITMLQSDLRVLATKSWIWKVKFEKLAASSL